jgi:hypothetical protein
MPQVQRIGNGQGDMEIWDLGNAAGIGKCIRIAAPVNGQPGFAPGCEYVQYFPTYAVRFINAGSSTSAFWVENDALAGNGTVFGNASGPVASTSLLILGSGNVARDIGLAAGKSPSVNALDKIVYALWIPAGSFDVSGRGLQVTVYGTAAANGANKEFKVFLGATNTVFPTLPAVDGTITVAGGTVIGDTGVLTTNNGAIILTCQIFKRGAAASNTQESMTTGIIGGTAHGGAGKWTDQTFAENTNLLLAITAQSTTTPSDVVYNGSEITAFN